MRPCLGILDEEDEGVVGVEDEEVVDEGDEDVRVVDGGDETKQQRNRKFDKAAPCNSKKKTGL